MTCLTDRHMRAVCTMFNCLVIVGQIYMKRTYIIFGINNYILLLHWGTLFQSLMLIARTAIHAKEMKYDLGDHFNLE